MRAGASAERLRAPLAELTADAPAGSASGDDVHDDAPSTSGRPPSFPGGGLRGILRASRDPSSGPRLRRLLLFTSLREFKPSEPFLVELYESRGLGAGTLTNDVFPAWTHARLPALVFVCAVAARFGCRRAVILGTACGMVTVGMTAAFALFARAMNADAPTVLGVPALAWARASQVFAAVAFASHQAFLGIAFSDPSADASFDEASASRGTRGEAVTRTFPAVAHGVKAATLLATCVSALLGQALARFGAPLASLLALTFATQTGSLLVARAFEKDISISGEEALPRTLPRTSFAVDEGNEGNRLLGSASGSEAAERTSVVGASRFAKRTPRSFFFGARAFFRASYLASRAIVADPSVAAWCLWSVASAPTHAFVAANWQTLVTETPGCEETRGNETGAKTFAFGAWLAAQRAAACLATLAFGAVAYGALVRSGPGDEQHTKRRRDRSSPPNASRQTGGGGTNVGRAAARRDDDDDEARDATDAASSVSNESSLSLRSGFVNPERSLFAASASLGASACFLFGASLAATRTSAALFVTAFVCVFEAVSSVCAAAVGLEAGRAVTSLSERATNSLAEAVTKSATSLAFVFASLSACGYAVDASTQGVTDLLSLDVRRRFEARAAFAAFAAGAFLVFLRARYAFRAKTPASLSVTGEAESAAATRAPLGASDADDPSARLLVAEDEA